MSELECFDSPALLRLREVLPEALLTTHALHGDATAGVAPDRIVDVARLLREDPLLRFEMLTDLCAVDHLGATADDTARFEVVYHFYSVERNQRVRIKARVYEAEPELPSLTPLYASADWMEREVFDLYGVRFTGHPNLKRILLYDAFEGHPLRKDYRKEKRQPLIGPGS